MRPADGVFAEEDGKRRASMRGLWHALTMLAGAILFAAFIFILACAPGFLTDAASTVPVTSVTEAGQ
jgi:hypothetical protein